MRTARGVLAGLLCAAALISVSCTRTVHDVRAVAGPDRTPLSQSDAQCSPVDVPLTDVAVDSGEPGLRIPQPAGWQRVDRRTSPVVRYAMRNPDAATDGFAPTAVLTVERAGQDADPQQIFDQEFASLRQLGVTDLDAQPHTVCGHPAALATYTIPALGPVGPHPAVVLCVVSPAADHAAVVTLTVQWIAADADLRRDVTNILDGLQVSSGPS